MDHNTQGLHLVSGSGSDYFVHNVIGIVSAASEIATKVVRLRRAGKR
jgi:hypothetical protein